MWILKVSITNTIKKANSYEMFQKKKYKSYFFKFYSHKNRKEKYIKLIDRSVPTNMLRIGIPKHCHK